MWQKGSSYIPYVTELFKVLTCFEISLALKHTSRLPIKSRRLVVESRNLDFFIGENLETVKESLFSGS